MLCDKRLCQDILIIQLKIKPKEKRYVAMKLLLNSFLNHTKKQHWNKISKIADYPNFIVTIQFDSNWIQCFSCGIVQVRPIQFNEARRRDNPVTPSTVRRRGSSNRNRCLQWNRSIESPPLFVGSLHNAALDVVRLAVSDDTASFYSKRKRRTFSPRASVRRTCTSQPSSATASPRANIFFHRFDARVYLGYLACIARRERERERAVLPTSLYLSLFLFFFNEFSVEFGWESQSVGISLKIVYHFLLDFSSNILLRYRWCRKEKKRVEINFAT